MRWRSCGGGRRSESLSALLLPAIFSAWAMIHYANETATWTLLVGGGLITAANVLIQLKPAAKG